MGVSTSLNTIYGVAINIQSNYDDSSWPEPDALTLFLMEKTGNCQRDVEHESRSELLCNWLQTEHPFVEFEWAGNLGYSSQDELIMIIGVKTSYIGESWQPYNIQDIMVSSHLTPEDMENMKALYATLEPINDDEPKWYLVVSTG